MLITKIASAQDGYAKPPAVQMQYFNQMLGALNGYRADLEQMYSESLIVDDAMRTDMNRFLEFLVTRCETLICLENKQVIAIAILHPGKAGRIVETIGWAHPEYRQGYKNQKKLLSFVYEDVLEHAFKTLKAVRIETRCHVDNRSAIRFATRVGFRAIGLARLDFQIQGQLFDSLLLELINPDYDIQPLKEKTHDDGKRERAATEPERARDDVHGYRSSDDNTAVQSPAENIDELRDSPDSDVIQCATDTNVKPSRRKSGYIRLPSAEKSSAVLEQSNHRE